MSFHMVPPALREHPTQARGLRKIDTDPKRRLKPRAVRDGDERLIPLEAEARRES